MRQDISQDIAFANQDGYCAYMMEESRNSNPHAACRAEHAAWNDGYDEAERDYGAGRCIDADL